jgi:hypothetical protein
MASSGCHDNRMDKTWWNEQWMGEMGPHYAASSNTEHAASLKGKLFLAVGEMDFFIRLLYGITPPDWNGGAAVQTQATSSQSPTPEPSDSPDAEGASAYGFFESPVDSYGPWWWWW